MEKAHRNRDLSDAFHQVLYFDIFVFFSIVTRDASLEELRALSFGGHAGVPIRDHLYEPAHIGGRPGKGGAA